MVEVVAMVYVSAGKILGVATVGTIIIFLAVLVSMMPEGAEARATFVESTSTAWEAMQKAILDAASAVTRARG